MASDGDFFVALDKRAYRLTRGFDPKTLNPHRQG